MRIIDLPTNSGLIWFMKFHILSFCFLLFVHLFTYPSTFPLYFYLCCAYSGYCIAFGSYLILLKFNLIAGVAQENGSISEDIIRNAVSATEDGFLTLVRRSYGIKPLIAAMGSCCLVGVIWKGTLYIANLGDSRAVIGSVGRSNKIIAEQLTKEHNASKEEVRRELKSLHPEDSQIVVMKQGTWRIKGIIQVFFSL